MQDHEFFMNECLLIAEKGKGNVSPNPMVGCVIVAKGKIIGQGYHKQYGKEHAEANAILSVSNKELLKESTLYVNLEPCAHFGNTPPCANLIIKNQIPKVVIGCIDVFPKVSGKGIEIMKNAGIKITYGILKNSCNKLNKRFITFHTKKRPYILLKWAESNDGFIAPENQTSSFWMTSNESKELVHKYRAEEDAILIGRKTVEKDNPLLTVREIKGRNPIRIIIDPLLRLKKNFNIFNNESDTLIFNYILDKEEGNNHFIKVKKNKIIEEVMKILYAKNIQSIIIEGGRATIQNFIDNNIWDEARVFVTNKKLLNGVIAPKIKGKIISRYKSGVDELINYKYD